MLSLIKFSECCLISCVLIVSVVYAVGWESATGCPKGNPANGELYLKHQRNGKCYRVNSRGPCGQNMIFIPYPNIVVSSKASPNYARSDSRRPSVAYGFCDCFDAIKETEEELAFIRDFTSDCIQDKRTQIYVPQRKRCYSAFHQGPCNEGKWLVLNSTFHPICIKNVCGNRKTSQFNQLTNIVSKNSEYSPKFIFSRTRNGPCYETRTQGYCPKNHILRATSNHWLPTCSYLRQDRDVKCKLRNEVPTVEIPTSRCKPGSRIDFLTGCAHSINPR